MRGLFARSDAGACRAMAGGTVVGARAVHLGRGFQALDVFSCAGRRTGEADRRRGIRASWRRLADRDRKAAGRGELRPTFSSLPARCGEQGRASRLFDHVRPSMLDNDASADRHGRSRPGVPATGPGCCEGRRPARSPTPACRFPPRPMVATAMASAPSTPSMSATASATRSCILPGWKQSKNGWKRRWPRHPLKQIRRPRHNPPHDTQTAGSFGHAAHQHIASGQLPGRAQKLGADAGRN
jgi:hypothetical protein